MATSEVDKPDCVLNILLGDFMLASKLRTLLKLRSITPAQLWGQVRALESRPILPPILQGLGQVLHLYYVALGQVGDGPGHPQHLVVGPGAQLQLFK